MSNRYVKSGVRYYVRRNMWKATVVNPNTSQLVDLGLYDTKDDAFAAREDWWANPHNVSYERWLVRQGRVASKISYDIERGVISESVMRGCGPNDTGLPSLHQTMKGRLP